MTHVLITDFRGTLTERRLFDATGRLVAVTFYRGEPPPPPKPELEWCIYATSKTRVGEPARARLVGTVSATHLAAAYALALKQFPSFADLHVLSEVADRIAGHGPALLPFGGV